MGWNVPTLEPTDGRTVTNAWVRIWDPTVNFATNTARAGLQAFVNKAAKDAGKAEVPMAWDQHYVEVEFERGMTVLQIMQLLYIKTKELNSQLANATIDE